MYMETHTLTVLRGSDAFHSLGALHNQLVLAFLVSTCSTLAHWYSALVLTVEPLVSRGSQITVSLRFAGTERAQE